MIRNSGLYRGIQAVVGFVFDTSHYHTAVEIYRAQAIYGVTFLVVLVMTLYGIAVPEWSAGGQTDMTMIEAAVNYPTSIPGTMFIALIGLSILTFIVNRLGLTLVARWSPVALWLLSGVTFFAFSSESPGDVGGAIVVLLIIGALTAGWRALVIGVVGSVIVLFLRSGTLDGYYINPVGPSVPAIIFQSIGSALLVYVFLRYARVTREEGAAEAVEGRMVAAGIVTSIAQRVAQRVSLDDLLSEMVEAINDQFDEIYHTQVFLIEETGVQARLVASTGQIGRELLRRGHELAVGSRSVIGQVTLHGTHVIAKTGSGDQVHRRNELLRDTQVEAAFPLRVGNRVIGALDLQSRQADVFDSGQLVSTFQALADSISLAVDNLDNYQQAQSQLRENARLVEETQRALRQVSRLNERLTGQAWARHLAADSGVVGMAVDFERNELADQSEMTPMLRDAILINQLVQDEQDGQQVIAVPLHVGGRVIGAMEFELDEDRKFTPEDLDLVKEVGERFGYAVENSRLLDESQRLALREFMVNQVGNRIQRAQDVEDLLSEVAYGLQEVLGAQRVAIRLGTASSNENGG